METQLEIFSCVKNEPLGVPAISQRIASDSLRTVYQKSKELALYPFPNLKFVFKKGAADLIKEAKGWRTDAEMAKHLGFTRQYVSALNKRKVQATHQVICRIAYCLGNLDKWYLFYEVAEMEAPLPSNHPIFNFGKYEGIIPYERNSVSAVAKSQDYDAETL